MKNTVTKEELINKYVERYTESDVQRKIVMTLSHVMNDISNMSIRYPNDVSEEYQLGMLEGYLQAHRRATSVITDYMEESMYRELIKKDKTETADDFDEKGAIV